MIVQYFSAGRFLTIFIKVEALSPASVTLTTFSSPPSSFHRLLFSLPLNPLVLSSLITSPAFYFLCNDFLTFYHLWRLFSFPSIYQLLFSSYSSVLLTSFLTSVPVLLYFIPVNISQRLTLQLHQTGIVHPLIS